MNIFVLVETHLTLSKSNNTYKQDEIIQMLEFLINNIFVLFGGRFVSIGLWCRHPSRASQEYRYKNSTYINDVLSMNNSRFSDYLNRIYWAGS